MHYLIRKKKDCLSYYGLHNTGLVRGYIDLTKACDKVNRGVLWRILRLYGVPEAIVKVIIAFHESAQAVLQLNGEISTTKIQLNRGLKQGSVLSPILFNIFFGVLTREFEKRCAERTTIDEILGVRVQYNVDGGFMDDTQKLRPKNPDNNSRCTVCRRSQIQSLPCRL
jgi:hypothetical protein